MPTVDEVPSDPARCRTSRPGADKVPLLLRPFRLMTRIREFELHRSPLMAGGQLAGVLHESIAQETIAAGGKGARPYSSPRWR